MKFGAIKFWAWLIGGLTVMMAMLTIAPNFVVSSPKAIITESYAIWGLSVAMIASLVAFIKLKSYPINHPLIYGVVSVLLGVLPITLMAMRAYQSASIYEQNRLHAPMMVTATVQITELSDGIYDPKYNHNYRQKARLVDIRPLQTPPATNTQLTDNPFAFKKEQTSTHLTPPQTSSDTLPQSLDVFLTAKAHTPSTKNPNDPLAQLSTLKVGQQVSMNLALTPIVVDNSVGFDSSTWAKSEHIHAYAKVLAINEMPADMTVSFGANIRLKIERWREYYRAVFYEMYDKHPTADTAVALSLLTGDRALIDKPTKELYQYAGISHLLAISGAHVLFLAVLLASLITTLAQKSCITVYKIIPRWQMRFVVMVVVSLLYALFTGFDVPAVRTVVMLLVVGVARYLLLGVSSVRLLAISAVVMAWIDPYVLVQAGFWLSFVAVFLLFHYENGYQKSLTYQDKLKNFIALQIYIFVAMLPISLLLFGKVSLLGLVVNVFAVGLFGLVIVPINLLAGVLFVIVPSVAKALWWVVIALLGKLHDVLGILELLAGYQWLNTPMTIAMLVLFIMGFLMIKSKVLPKRLAILPLFVLACAIHAKTSGISTTDNQVMVTRLASDTPNLSQVLVRQGDDVWLMLSWQKFGYQKPDGVTIATKLSDKLNKLGVNHLTAIVVQTPDETLAKTAGQISLTIPTYQLWWAGASSTNTPRFGNLTAQACKADKQHAFGDGMITALTGYQELADSAMHHCSLMIDSINPVVIDGDVVDIDGKDKTISPTEFENTRLIIDGGGDGKIWQVYELLCQDKPIAKAFLVHSQADVSDSVLKSLGNPQVIFTNHLKNAQLRQYAKNQLQNQ